jgi:hypothetical protein
MATYSKVIQVPEPAPGSYNPNRPAGTLLLSQALHMREALVQHSKALEALLALDPKSLKTEADVSEYVHQVTAMLHTHGPKPKKK